ncbi:MAG: leucine-rich repeat protein [Clostridia bacterium]|nr:leucine-rich repeat protein [Clostridia bacterium]
MKKKIFFLLCVITILSLLFAGCSDREKENNGEQPPVSSGVTVSFDTRMPGYTIAPLFLDGTEKEMPDTPFYAGYTFLGWYYDTEYTKIFTITDGFTKDTTLYAKWRKNQATIDPSQAPEKETDVGGFVYVKEGNEYFVTGYTGGLPEITLPETYKDLPVSGVKSGAFNGSIVRKINLPASVKTVEGGAFAGAAKLQAVGVAGNNPAYTSADGVLFNKESTTLVCLPAMGVATGYVLPATVEEIAPFALHGCVITLHFSTDCKVKTLTKNAFTGFSGDVMIPDSVVEIEKFAFSGANCRVSFTTSSNVVALRNGAFDGFIGAKIKVPASVTEISGSAFYGCGAEIDLSLTGLTALGDNAFNGYLGRTLFIPASVTSLGSGCFYRCSSEIIFDERSDLRTIGENAFSNFSGKVTFPASVKTVGKNAFYNASSSAEIVFSARQSEISVDETAFKSSLAKVTYQQ